MATPYCTARPTYIYALCEPDVPWNVRYIGKVQAKEGESPEVAIPRRLQWHLYECRYPRSKTRRHNWLRHLSTQEKLPTFCLIDQGDESSWEELERFYIKAYRSAGFDLVNLTDGGDGTGGYVITPEARLALSRALKGRKQSSEWVAKRMASAKKTPRKSPSEETRAKMSQAHTGLKLKPESIEKLRRAKTGKPGHRWSEESIAKREATKRAQAKPGPMIGRKHRLESIEKMRQSHQGYMHTEETKAAISAANLRRWAENPKTHCIHGHEYTPENTYIDPRGNRRCRICRYTQNRRKSAD